MVVISCCTPQLEDLPELIHRIQSLLPAKEAARTCILSKSWLHAWSTIPTLRFPCQSLTSYNKLIDSTLMREALSLSSKFDIDIEDSSHHARVSSKTKVDDLRRRVSFPVRNVQPLTVHNIS
ncbi:peroxisomal membrane protein 11B [Tanacetum coccineum]